VIEEYKQVDATQNQEKKAVSTSEKGEEGDRIY
jgi:hypothetical protein